MKKLFSLAAIAVTMGMMTSCTQNEDFTSNGIDSNTIAFATRSNKVATRSGETINTINKFTVSAVNNDNTSFFSNEEFTYDGSTGVFKSQTPHYWPVSGTLSFYAINEKGTLALGSNAIPSYTYENWTATTDLVAATVKAGTKQMPYPLTFKHLTSQVRISAESENKTEQLTYKLKAVRMSAPAKGVYSFADVTGGVGSWDIDIKTTKTYDYSEGIGTGLTCDNNGSIKLNSTYWNILPTTDGSLDFEVEYNVSQNGKVIADFTGENAKKISVSTPNLSAGKQYTYNFILALGSEDVITFTTTIDDWNTATNEDLEFVTPAQSVAVDLGLPSGLKWAAGNIGAKTETDTGLYFEWGETTGHSLASDYIFSDDVYSAKDVSKFVSTGNDLVLPQKYDAAYTNLGSDWRMPTKTDIEELLNGCTSQWMADYEGSGVAGTLLTSKSNGKKLFFPATGKNYGNGNINWYGSCGLIWSSSYFWGDVWVIRYTRTECQLSIDNQRFAGLQVRGVCE